MFERNIHEPDAVQDNVDEIEGWCCQYPGVRCTYTKVLYPPLSEISFQRFPSVTSVPIHMEFCLTHPLQYIRTYIHARGGFRLPVAAATSHSINRSNRFSFFFFSFLSLPSRPMCFILHAYIQHNIYCTHNSRLET